MKLSADIDVTAQIRAVLREDGTLDLRATATAEYATGARASARLEVPAAQRETVRLALEAALKAATTQGALHRVLDACSVSRTVARAMGEIAP